MRRPSHPLLAPVLCMALSTLWACGLSSPAATNAPPVLAAMPTNPPGTNQFWIAGRPGKVFRVETGFDFTNWTPISSFTACSNPMPFSVARQQPDVLQMYRVWLSPSTNPPVWTNSFALSYDVVDPNTVSLSWQPAADLLDVVGYRVYLDGQLLADLPATSRFFSVDGLSAGDFHALSVQAGNEDFQWSTNGPALVVNTRPPDPASIAPDPPAGAAPSLSSSTEFLYSGTNAIQAGIGADAFESHRQAVVRGSVFNESNAPLDGIVVSVADHPEFGSTVTRADGAFDLAVNGDSVLGLNFRKPGFLPLQRTVSVPRQDFVVMDPVVMKAADTNESHLVLGGAAGVMQVARGSWVSDDDGIRRASVMIPPGTSAAVLGHDGTTQQIASLTTRFTEYTAGTNGPAAMPGDLPPAVAYTYAVELGADEAIAKVAGRDVLFSTQIYFYVDNFLGMPAGTPVPSGYYDKDAKAWIPSPNGLSIDLLGTNETGLAQIDADGDALPDSDAALASLGFSPEERLRLAEEHAPSASLWRIPLEHFSTYDFNYGLAAAAGATPPAFAFSPAVLPMPPNHVVSPPPIPEYGQIDRNNLGLSETLSVPGTPLRLRYDSLALSPSSANRIDVPLTGSNVPAPLLRVHLTIRIAGRTFHESFAPAPNLSHSFEWDGFDAYGRRLFGPQPVGILVAYEYPAYYAMPPAMSASFGAASGVAVPGMVRSRDNLRLSQSFSTFLGGWDCRSLGLGGWQFEVQKVFDPVRRVLVGHAPANRFGDAIAPVECIVAGTGAVGYSGDGSPALDATLESPSSLAVDVVGNLLIVDRAHSVVRQIDVNGTISTVAGTGTHGFSGDGGPAAAAQFNSPWDIDVAPDGSIYVADHNNNRIRKIDPNGIVSTVAGNGLFQNPTEGGPATSISVPHPVAVSADSFGNAYYVTAWNIDYCKIWRIGPDGIASIVAGLGSEVGTGGPAFEARIGRCNDLAIAPDGSIFYSEGTSYGGNCRIRRIAPDGIVYPVAGTGTAGFSGDGGPADLAQLSAPGDLAFGADGALYFIDAGNDRIRRISPDGIISTVAAKGPGEEGNPLSIASLDPLALAAGRDMTLFVADYGGYIPHVQPPSPRIRRIGEPQPGFYGQALSHASPDGSEFYRFDSDGRHLTSHDTLTGALLREFSYSNGLLVGIADSAGRATRIERNAAGTPLAIVSPDGLRTEMEVDANGLLARWTPPDGASYRFGYDSRALLTNAASPLGHAYRFAYDATGRISSASMPSGHGDSFGHVALSNGAVVFATNAWGGATSHRWTRSANGASTQISQWGGGLSNRVESAFDGSSSFNHSSGASLASRERPDPRFGLQAPYRSEIVSRLPSGLSSTQAFARSVLLADRSDPLSLLAATNVASRNGKPFVQSYDSASRTLSILSPEGRLSEFVLNAVGRIVQARRPGKAPVDLAYDSAGRIASVSSHARQVDYRFDSNGHLREFADASGRTNRLFCDVLGRITNQILPGGAQAAIAWDADGRIVSVTPPGRPLHAFAYTPEGRVSAYVPPVVGSSDDRVVFAYGPGLLLKSTTFPDGSVVSNAYDGNGRLVGSAAPGETQTYSYDPTNGKLSSVASSLGVSNRYVFDGPLLLSEEWQGSVAGLVARTYDRDFQLSSLRVNLSAPVAFQYDNDGLLAAAGALQIHRAADSGLVLSAAVGVVSAAYRHDPNGRVTSIVARASGSNLFSAAYAYDAAGRLSSAAESVLGDSVQWTYQYNLDGSLAAALSNGAPAFACQYDGAGNRTNVWRNGQSVSGAFDARDRILSWGDDVFGHSPLGQITNRLGPASETRFVYDPFGNLLSVQKTGGVHVAYLLDPLGRRIQRSVDGAPAARWLYRDGYLPVAELDAANGLRTLFVYGVRPNVPDLLVRTGQTCAVVADFLGTPRLVVDAATGAVRQRLDLDPFGLVLADSNPCFQPFGFAGGLLDPATGLLRFGHRDYDPDTARWLSRDPVLFAGGSYNLYAYCNNDPVNRIDPSGLGPGSQYPNADYEHYQKIKAIKAEIDRLQPEYNMLVAAQHDSRLAPLVERGGSSPSIAISDASYSSAKGWEGGHVSIDTSSCDWHPGGQYFWSLGNHLQELRKELARLERQAGKKSGWEKFRDSFLDAPQSPAHTSTYYY